MNACILTVIKNEHEYLDEWIKYHLNLGIKHIFILEDTDSESHKDITDMYEGSVTLSGVFSVLDEENQRKATEFKKTKERNVQDLYFKNGLKFIKDTYQDVYDWCFIIDIDEFVTFQNKDDVLENVLSLYNDYDAFMMSWKCYGASGHITKPDYSKSGVVETYTEKAKGSVPNNPVFHTKSCYNLKKYDLSVYGNNHQPSKTCKWCRTDFSDSRTEEIYDKIFIRHYITKSWEEYAAKKYNRGFFVGISRTDNFFFDLNPDMKYIKKELVSQIEEGEKKEVLVVLPYKQSGSQGKELQLCLNGWKKFCQFKNHFVVIGEFDQDFVKKYPWVEFIPCKTKEKKPGQYNPHLDIQHKMEFVMNKYRKKYDGFIDTCDDIYPIKPFTFNDILQTHYHSTSFTGDAKAPKNYWNYDKWKTRHLFDRNGMTHVNYTTHFPYWYDFKRLEEIWDKFNLRNESYVHEDVYFNYFSHETPVLDSKICLGIWSPEIFKKEFKNAVNDPNIKFVCNSVEGWCPELEIELEKIVS